MDYQILKALLGGALIGIAVILMLLFNGRVTGISGIINSSLEKQTPEGRWRWLFLAGMVAGGVAVHLLNPEMLWNFTDNGPGRIILAGLLVGYGTVMGSGCTSGHGVCGIGRLSVRSIIATITFMIFGVIAVQVMSLFFGGTL